MLVANSSCATPRFTDQALVKPWSRQPPLSPWQAHNAHCINVQRSSAAALWGESSDRCVISVHDAHNISFILLKLALVGRLPFIVWHIRPRRVCRCRDGGGSLSESILGESGKWRGHRAAMRRHSVKMSRRASLNGKLDARWMRLVTAGL